MTDMHRGPAGARRGVRRRVPGAAALCAASVLALTACTAGSETPAPDSSAVTTSPATPATHNATAARRCDTPAPAVLNEVEPSVVTVRTPVGLGSGIVFKPDVIITDQHVVARHEGESQTFHTVEIVLADGSTTSGTVIGSDVDTDLAVIRTKRKHLPPLSFRSSPPVQGQTVLAVGSPLGLSNTATRGIVSALGRDLPAQAGRVPLVNLIQTDAAISPGNSGGALIDLCGRVVGVNEAYIPPKAGAVSIGFATPAAVAVDIASQLLSTGSVTHPVIGVAVRDLTPQIKRALDVRATHGVIVVRVAGDGPAAQAGVTSGDVITKFNGERIDDYADLVGAVRMTDPGQTVNLTISRDAQPRKLTLTVGSRDTH